MQVHTDINKWRERKALFNRRPTQNGEEMMEIEKNSLAPIIEMDDLGRNLQWMLRLVSGGLMRNMIPPKSFKLASPKLFTLPCLAFPTQKAQ